MRELREEVVEREPRGARGERVLRRELHVPVGVVLQPIERERDARGTLRRGANRLVAHAPGAVDRERLHERVVAERGILRERPRERPAHVLGAVRDERERALDHSIVAAQHARAERGGADGGIGVLEELEHVVRLGALARERGGELVQRGAVVVRGGRLDAGRDELAHEFLDASVHPVKLLGVGARVNAACDPNPTPTRHRSLSGLPLS